MPTGEIEWQIVSFGLEDGVGGTQISGVPPLQSIPQAQIATSNRQGETVELCHCNECFKQTHHKVIFTEVREEALEQGIRAGTNYEVIECQGCLNITFRKRDWCSEWVNEDGPNYGDSYYPPLVSRNVPEWIVELPQVVQSVMNEVYTSLHAGSRYLATLGTRTALDLVMTERVGDTGTFKQKIEALKSQAYINNAEATLIDVVIEAGNASAHRGFAPESGDIAHVLDILESVLDKVYVAAGRQRRLDEKAAELMKKVPRRHKSNGS